MNTPDSLYKENEVYYKGKLIATLNPYLIKRQKITAETLAVLRETHVTKYMIFEQAKKTNDERKLKVLAALFEELEFRQQLLWGFNHDASYHRWFDFPKCKCPKLDNSERLGVRDAGRIISQDCKVHWVKDKFPTKTVKP